MRKEHWPPELLERIAADYPHMTGDLLKEKYGFPAAKLRDVLRKRGIRVLQSRRVRAETRHKAAVSSWITRYAADEKAPLDCVTRDQAAAYLGISIKTISQLAQRGLLRAHRQRSSNCWIWQISEADIHRFLRRYGGFMRLSPVVEEFAETYAAARAAVRKNYITVDELSKLAYVDPAAAGRRLQRHGLKPRYVARKTWYARAAALAIYGITEHADGTITRS